MLRIGDDTGGGVLADMDAQTRDTLRSLAGRLPAREWLRAIKLFNQAQLDLRGSDQNQIALELALVEASLEEASLEEGLATAAAAAQPTASTQPVARPVTPTVQAAPAPTPVPVSEQRAAAPPRSTSKAAPESPPTAVSEPRSEPTGDEVTVEQVNQSWAQIRQTIRAQSRPVEALVNSAVLRGIEGSSCLVFDLPSRLLCEKLEKAETRRMIEEAICSALGKRCTIRAQVAGAAGGSVIQEASPPFERAPVAAASAQPAAGQNLAGPTQPVLPPAEVLDWEQQARNDPLVQALKQLGGQVIKMEPLGERGKTWIQG